MNKQQYSIHQGWDTVARYKGVAIKQQTFIKRLIGGRPWDIHTTYGNTFMAYGKRFKSIPEAKAYLETLALIPRPMARESMEIIRHEIEGM